MIKRGVYQIKKINPDAGVMLVSGNVSKFKENQPVELKAYDTISLESRGFYYAVLVNHLVDIVGYSRKDIHDLLRYQCGYIEQVLTPNGYIENLKSTDNKSINQKEYSKFIDKVWHTLTIQGLRINNDTIIEPKDLFLDVIMKGYDKIKALREFEKVAKNEKL